MCFPRKVFSTQCRSTHYFSRMLVPLSRTPKSTVTLTFYRNSILLNKQTNQQNSPYFLWMVFTYHLQLPSKVNLVNLVCLFVC